MNKFERYILDAIDAEGHDVNPVTEKEKINFLMDTFEAEYGNPYNKNRWPIKAHRLTEWLKGLPSCIYVPFYGIDILNDAATLGIKGSDDKIIENWFMTIAIEIVKLHEKLNK